MEPPAKQLCVFTGQGIGPTYPEWKIRVLAALDERQIRASVLPPQEEMNAAARRTYFKNDAILYNLLLMSLSGEALLFAMQNFGLTEETRPGLFRPRNNSIPGIRGNFHSAIIC